MNRHPVKTRVEVGFGKKVLAVYVDVPAGERVQMSGPAFQDALRASLEAVAPEWRKDPVQRGYLPYDLMEEK